MINGCTVDLSVWEPSHATNSPNTSKDLIVSKATSGIKLSWKVTYLAWLYQVTNYRICRETDSTNFSKIYF